MTPDNAPILTAHRAGLRGCRSCGRVWPEGQETCDRCGADVDLSDPTNVLRPNPQRLTDGSVIDDSRSCITHAAHPVLLAGSQRLTTMADRRTGALRSPSVARSDRALVRLAQFVGVGTAVHDQFHRYPDRRAALEESWPELVERLERLMELPGH